MSGFEKHGLKHTSASQINMYADAPCVWVAKYLFGRRLSFGLAARAGVLVEDAVVNVLADGMSAEDATERAVKEYGKQAAIGTTDAELKRGEAIPAMIELALEALAPYGEPEFDECAINGRKQKQIELVCNGDGWKLPIMGFLDFDYPKHGVTVDLKTTMRLPSSLSRSHARQGAIYKKSRGNHAMKFLYVTGSKSKILDIEDEAVILKEVKAILNRQEKMLRLDSDQIKDIVPVMSSSFYWTGDEALREEMYGI